MKVFQNSRNAVEVEVFQLCFLNIMNRIIMKHLAPSICGKNAGTDSL